MRIEGAGAEDRLKFCFQSPGREGLEREGWFRAGHELEGLQGRSDKPEAGSWRVDAMVDR